MLKFYNQCGSCEHIDLNHTKDLDDCYRYDEYSDHCNKYYCTKYCEFHYLTDDVSRMRCTRYKETDENRDYGIISDMSFYGGSYSRRQSSGNYPSSSGCYITTIVTKLLGLGDNNELLNTLRLFRKNTLQTNPMYKNILMEYDIVGPIIADCIENDRELYDINILEKYIRYCVSLVKQGKETEAVTIYTNMVYMLKEIFNISFEQVKCDNYDYTVGGHGYIKNR